MRDYVNTDVRQDIQVRPFMVDPLIHAEKELVDHHSEEVLEIDPLEALYDAKQKILEAMDALHSNDSETAFRKIAHAMNYVGMAYEGVEQIEMSKIAKEGK